MQTKLTLRLEDQLIAEAKRYSKQHGKSLSQLVSDYFVNLKQRDADLPNQHQASLINLKSALTPPITSALRGVLGSAAIDEADYHKYLEDKYLGERSQ